MSGVPAIIAAMALAGFACTYVWRMLAVIAVSNADPESRLLLWVRAVATSLVAALVMRIAVHPSGVLAEVSGLPGRLVPLAVGVGVFYLARRNPEAGTFGAVLAFLGWALFAT